MAFLWTSGQDSLDETLLRWGRNMLGSSSHKIKDALEDASETVTQ